MINKFNYNLRVNGYKMMGVLWYITPIILAIITIYKDKTWESLWISLLFIAVYCVLSGVLRYGAKFDMISISKILRKPKLVFHDQLGYFSVYFFDSSVEKPAYIEIYKQSILRVEFIGYLNFNNQEQIRAQIKSTLDIKYHSELRKIEKKKEDDKRIECEKSLKGELDEWDGYLTTVGRRDSKIKSIISKK